MKPCKRCKINERKKGSVICEKCDNKNKTRPITKKKQIKFNNTNDAYGGLGREYDIVIAGHLENI